jgi:TetR/AcrR family transcriptional regulator
MPSRAEQREGTRDRIVEAATAAFAEHGFGGASTRDIANRAGTNQGLITYHFRSKEELWKAAADRLFGLLREELATLLADTAVEDPRERAREGIRAYVRFAAAHPELLRFMMEEGTRTSPRGQWLLKTHLAPMYETFGNAATGLIEPDDDGLRPHAFYAMAGAASLLFAVPSEARRLAGIDPRRKAVVEAHADYVARLILP